MPSISGIRYIDTAKNYLTYGMMREALKPLPRDKYFLLSKMPSGGTGPEDPLKTIDQYRQDLGVDYIDALLIHCTVTADWPERMKRVMDAFDEAQARGWIRAKGMSCHGLAALRVAAKSDWLEVQLARINPQGHHVDGDHPTNPHDPQRQGSRGDEGDQVDARQGAGRHRHEAGRQWRLHQRR
jgi:diketogulonate reductase-like aldo/keto reductase